MSAVANSYSSLGYTFPVFDLTPETNSSLPRDAVLSQTLRFTPINSTPETRTVRPVNKVFHNAIPSSGFNDPLAEVLFNSRRILSRALESCTQNIAANANKPAQENGIADYKKTKKSITTNTQRKISGAIVDSSSRSSTPIANKTIFFSPSSKAQGPATQAMFKEPHFNSKRKISNNIRHKLLKIDQASLFNIKQDTKAPVQIHHDNNDYDDSDYDHLACHADNIMRMAVDSTMLGSTFNSSFSSLNDSFNGGTVFDRDSRKNILDGLTF